MNEVANRSAVTIFDVAREAGVGESTVSRVLRGKGAVSPEARERVLAATEKLGYVPNRIAGTLASTGSRLVGFVIPSVNNIVFADVLTGAEGVLSSLDRQAVFAITEYDAQKEEQLVESMLAWRPSGLVVAGLEHTDRARAMIRGSGVRVAEILDTDGEGMDFVVGYSNREAGRVSARHLVERGRRRIGYVGHDLGRDLRSGKRLAGFRDGLAEAGMSLVDAEVRTSPSSAEAGRLGLAELLARNPDLDAVYFSNDDMALGGYFHCLAAGIDVPGRLALMGYNGLEVSSQTPRPITTIRTPRRRIGEEAARLVASAEPAGVHDLGFELIEGGTV